MQYRQVTYDRSDVRATSVMQLSSLGVSKASGLYPNLLPASCNIAYPVFSGSITKFHPKRKHLVNQFSTSKHISFLIKTMLISDCKIGHFGTKLSKDYKTVLFSTTHFSLSTWAYAYSFCLVHCNFIFVDVHYLTNIYCSLLSFNICLETNIPPVTRSVISGF